MLHATDWVLFVFASSFLFVLWLFGVFDQSLFREVFCCLFRRVSRINPDGDEPHLFEKVDSFVKKKPVLLPKHQNRYFSCAQVLFCEIPDDVPLLMRNFSQKDHFSVGSSKNGFLGLKRYLLGSKRYFLGG
jgi:hypothetical protein